MGIEIERSLSPDKEKQGRELELGFKPNTVHLSLLKEARKNRGIYERKNTVERIRNNPKLDDKLKKQMLQWNAIHIEKLEQAGYLHRIAPDRWELTPMAWALDIHKEFQLGANHVKLLARNENGKLSAPKLKEQWKGVRTKQAERNRKMIDGMLRRLTENEYLEKIDRGTYRLLEKGYAALEKADREPVRERQTTAPKSATLTYFDRHILDCLTDGKLDLDKLQKHPRSSSIEKRIKTLEKAGYLVDGKPSREFIRHLDHISIERTRSQGRRLSLDDLSKEQIQTLKDIRIFANLSLEQIARYIYQGDRGLAKIDLDFMCKKQALKRDEASGLYIFATHGIWLSNQLFPSAVKYKTKVLSRKEEVEHDMLIYDAYKNVEKDILAKGGKILEVKNDRQLRSEYAKEHGSMKNGFPDLRVYYQTATRMMKIHDIEVDCGYREKDILSKAQGIAQNQAALRIGVLRQTGRAAGKPNGTEQAWQGRDLGAQGDGDGVAATEFTWVCKSVYQAAKVSNLLTKDTTKRRKTTSKMRVSWIDEFGQLHQLRQ